MKAIITVLTAAALAAGTMPAAWAQDVKASGIFKDTDQIYDLCVAKDAASVEQCETYLMGVYDAISYFEDLEQIDNSICVPSGSKPQVLRSAFVAYVDAKPERRKYSAVSIAFNAFFTASFNACKSGSAWYLWPESNRHSFRNSILSRARLPIPPQRQIPERRCL